MHEWKTFDYRETTDNERITWVFQDFIPVAKLQGDKSYSIISDHIGTPLVAIDTQGYKMWERELDIYGKVRKETKENPNFVPFRYQGQYYDSEVDLCYNRFRYYDCNTGTYISQDPIGLAGGNPNIYAYVKDTNTWVDVFGLAATCQEEIKELPQFEGMTRDEIHRIAEERGFIKIKDRNGSQTFIKDTDDGMYVVVRTDTGKNTGQGYADDIDHSHKETTSDFIVKPNGEGFTLPRNTSVYNDFGEIKTQNDYLETHIPMN